MRNMKITTKLGVSFCIMSAVAVILGVISIFGLTNMSGAADDMYANKAKPLGDLTTATEYFQRLRVQVRNAIIYTGDTEQLKIVDSEMNDRITQFETSMANYKPSIVTDTGNQLFSDIMDQYNNTFKPGILRVLDDAKKGVDAEDLLKDMALTTEAANVIANDMASLVQARMDVMSNADDENKSLGNIMLMWTIIYMAVALIVSTLLSLYIPLSISKPVKFIKDILLNIGTKGDLAFTDDERRTIEKYASYKDETGESIAMLLTTVQRLNIVGSKLKAVADGDLTAEIDLLSDRDTMGISLQKMVSGLNELFKEINTSSVQVSSGSKQISDGAQVLAQGSSEQAAAVEQLTSSMSEMAEQIKENADTANRASALADTIKQNAEKGSLQMDEMMAAVKGINEASLSINKVIKVIDDIAFQTNILALNAAVEAARAG